MLREVELSARAGRWAVGFVSYEAAPAFDSALPTRQGPLPAAMFALFEGTDAIVRARGDFLCGAWHDTTSRESFDAGIGSIRADIGEGRCYQVNYTTRLRAPFFGDSLAFFDRLLKSQRGAYGAYLGFDRWRICSVSPELFFHWRSDSGALVSRPMKGTAARDDDPQRDRELAAQLAQSAKERAENLMIVDLIRNDMSRVAEVGSVTVPELFTVEAWPTVWQMTSTVTCRTRPQATLADVFAALFPCG